MADLYEYKCPNCGGYLNFDSDSQQVKCPYCDSVFDPAEFLSADASLENGPEGPDGEQSEETGLYVYVCESCGGELIADENLAATSCPYCGNPIIIKGNFTGNLKPDYVIPFQFDKEDAKKKLLEHFEGKKFLPDTFRTENKLEEIKGMYVPYWLYDGTATGNASYVGTKVRRWSDAHYYYTETSYYDIFLAGEYDLAHLPADASSKMDDILTQSLEPFPFDKAQDFQTAYLAGYLADKYDVNSEQTLPLVRNRSANTLFDSLRSRVHGYNSVQQKRSYAEFKNVRIYYALFPVWVMNTEWNGKKFTFAMNGATGKLVGNLPCDWKKVLTTSLLNFLWFGAAVAGALFALLLLLGY